MRSLLFFLMFLSLPASAQSADSDRDGLPDALEDALLQQFAPRLQVAADDCSVRPASFSPGITVPTAVADDGTLYGQATPRPRLNHSLHGTGAGSSKTAPAQEIELHFYHLWRRDCGRLGHALDAEHVAALLRLKDTEHPEQADAWRAVYWYTAAHEDTVCDASQIARASTVNAEKHGAEVWVSSGKHASFLTAELCTHGCGGDLCEDMHELPQRPVVNLGELRQPMNGAVWSSSPRWPGPLSGKLDRSDFLTERVARLERLPDTDVAWANPAKRPAQGAILGGNAAIDGALTGGRSTDTALSIASDKSGNAIGTAARSTGHALSKSWRNVRKALGAGSGETQPPSH